MASSSPLTSTSTITYSPTAYQATITLSNGSLQATAILSIPASAPNGVALGAPSLVLSVEPFTTALGTSPVSWDGYLLAWVTPTQIHIQVSPSPAISSQPILGSSSAPTFANNTGSPTVSQISTPTDSPTAPVASSSGTGTKSTTNKSSNVTSGAAAGIAIGCLIAGALIAGLIFWFCWRRKRKAAGVRDHEASQIALMPAHEKGFATNTVPLGSGSSAASPLSAALPLPLEDKAITGEISKIANSIKNHVQSYYQNGRVSPGLIDVDDIHALGLGQPISAGTLSTLLGNTATREIALRFCIAWAVCSKMHPGSDPKASLLPQEVSGCVHSITPQRDASPAQNSSALARWRVMTAELSQATYVREPFTNTDSRNASIQATLVVLENVLQPFADSRMDNGERKRNLEEILKRAALFAFTLFSQPSTWDFDWCEKQGVRLGELCIFPALVQLSDENGQPVNPPRPFSEAVVRRLSE